MHNILPSIYCFPDQYFFSSLVWIYALVLTDQLILIDVPRYTKKHKEFLLSFELPINCYLTHGSTGIADGTNRQKDTEIEISFRLHEADRDYNWLRMTPDHYYTTLPIHDQYEIIHTPGHTPGSICLLHHASKSLFAGDVLFGQGGKLINTGQAGHDDDSTLAQKSREILQQYNFDNVLPFHYEMFIGGVSE